MRCISLNHVINGDRCSQVAAPTWSHDKLRNVHSRYGSAMEAREVREVRIVLLPGLLLRTDGNPVELAISDDRFLAVLVRLHLAQEKRENQIIEQEPAVPGTVAGSDPRDKDQT